MPTLTTSLLDIDVQFYFLFISSALVPNLIKGNLFTTIPKWPKQWRVTLDIKPLGKINRFVNILQFTTGICCCEYGTRSPGIWFNQNSLNLFVVNSVNNDGNFHFILKNPLPINVFTKVTVEQIKINGEYRFRVGINGAIVESIVNNVPAEFSNVKVYSSTKYYEPANAIVKNIQINPIFESVVENTGTFIFSYASQKQ